MKNNCHVRACKNKAYYNRIELDAPNSIVLIGYLCEVHYNRLLDVIRAVINYGLPEKEVTVCPSLEKEK